MDFDTFKEIVFSAIAKHDGKWSWYQLDRHVSPQAPEMLPELLPALSQLESEGRIHSIKNTASPAQPLYALGSGEAA